MNRSLVVCLFRPQHTEKPGTLLGPLPIASDLIQNHSISGNLELEYSTSWNTAFIMFSSNSARRSAYLSKHHQSYNAYRCIAILSAMFLQFFLRGETPLCLCHNILCEIALQFVFVFWWCDCYYHTVPNVFLLCFFISVYSGWLHLVWNSEGTAFLADLIWLNPWICIFLILDFWSISVLFYSYKTVGGCQALSFMHLWEWIYITFHVNRLQ